MPVLADFLAISGDSRWRVEDWIGLGLLDRGSSPGRGRGPGRAARTWPDGQLELYRELRAARAEGEGVADCCDHVVAHWLEPGDVVPTRQARRALATWTDRAREPELGSLLERLDDAALERARDELAPLLASLGEAELAVGADPAAARRLATITRLLHPETLYDLRDWELLDDESDAWRPVGELVAEAQALPGKARLALAREAAALLGPRGAGPGPALARIGPAGACRAVLNMAGRTGGQPESKRANRNQT